jgi:hypothetical protein
MGHRLISSRRLASSLGVVALIAVLALDATLVRAAEPDPGAVELMDMFAEVCLQKFPDDTAVRQFAAEKRLDVMPAERLHRVLGTDPGEGWLRNTARGQYVLTVEMPPYHTCAIRKTDTKPPDFLVPLSLLLGMWTATLPGATLMQSPVQTAQVSGIPSQFYSWKLNHGPGKQVETLMAIVTTAAGNTQVRLVRQIKIE